MKGEERLLRIIGEIDAEFVQEAEQPKPIFRKNRKGWIGAAAACLCLLILWQVGLVPFSRMGGDVDPNHIWKEGFSPESYFADSEALDGVAEGGAFSSDAQPLSPGEEEPRITPLTDEWKALEKNELIPSLTGWDEFNAILTEEENQTDEWIQWLRTDSTEPPFISVMLSAGEGCMVKQEGVINQREDVFIYAAGTEETSKQLSFERNGVCTTITGSRNVTYEEMVEVLDWYWVHQDALGKTCEWADQKEELGK